MNPNVDNWDDDLPPEPEAVYQDLVRALKRKSGFGLFFVQCTPVEADRLIAKLPQDIPQKKIAVLRLVEAIDNLYERVAEFIRDKQIDILLIKGLEYSLYKYEKRTFGEITGGKFSDLTSVPHILNHLNQQRERFRDDYPICFVFLLRSFSINYLIHRSPDFFDWRSGIFEIPTTPEVVEEESSRLLLEGDYEEYLKYTAEQKIERILEIQELLTEKHQTESLRAKLLFKQGNLLVAANEYEGAIASYEEAVKILPDYCRAWYNRGIALQSLERYEEASNSFDIAVKIQEDFYLAWNNQGALLCDHMQRYEDAIKALEKAVCIQPEFYEAWYNLGIALFRSGCFLDAIANLDQALKIKPNDYKAWYARRNALHELDLLEEAIANYNKVIELKPEYTEVSSPSSNSLDQLVEDEPTSEKDFQENYTFSYRLESVFSGVVGYEEEFLPYEEEFLLDEEEFLLDDLVAQTFSLPIKQLPQYWQQRLNSEYPQQSIANIDSINRWLLGSDFQRFDFLNPKEIEIVKQAMEYRYQILLQRYLGIAPERAYRNLITRLASLMTLRHKIQTWVSLSRDRQRSVMDVLQEIIHELLQGDNYVQDQMAYITQITTDRQLRDALIFATIEEYCLRPIRNQPLLVYRFVNYLRRTQRGGLTQVPNSDLIRLVSDEILTEYEEVITNNERDYENNRENINFVKTQILSDYQSEQETSEETALHQAVQEEFEIYLQENLGKEAVQWLRLYLNGQSQDEIAKILNKPIKEVYRLREKISYHAVRVFALKAKPELVDSWLNISLQENNLGLTPSQWQQLNAQLTSIQQQILKFRKAGKTIEVIAQKLNLKNHQIMGEWTKIYLTAQALRTQQ
nr:HetZ-related protein 2 [Aulosira sp. DedVER01a]